MVKKVDNSVLDAALNEIKMKCDLMSVCSAEPATFETAHIEGCDVLGNVAMSATDFTITDGDISGRKVAVALKPSVNVDHTGSASHIALLDTENSTLLYVTTCTTQSLTSGNTVTFPTWDIEIADPI